MCGDLCLEPRTVQLNQNSAKNSRTKKIKCTNVFLCFIFTELSFVAYSHTVKMMTLHGLEAY